MVYADKILKIEIILHILRLSLYVKQVSLKHFEA